MGFPNYRDDAEKRLIRDTAEAERVYQQVAKLAKTNPEQVRQFLKDPDNAAYALFCRDLAGMTKTLNWIDEAKESVEASNLHDVEKQNRLQAIEEAPTNVLAHADGLSKLFFERRERAQGASPRLGLLPGGLGYQPNSPRIAVPGAKSMRRKTLWLFASLLFPAIASAQLTFSAQFSGPSPWYDVTSPTFGATCGSSDSTAAVQSAINVANSANGGTVYIPCELTIAGHLVLDSNLQAITLRGNCPANQNGSSIYNCLGRLTFTGNPSGALISAKATNAVHITDLFITYTNSSFTGNIIDFGSASVQSSHVSVERCNISGSPPISAAMDINLDKTIDSKVTDNVIQGNANIAIRGLSSLSSFSNVIEISRNAFGGSFPSGTIVNPGTAWKIYQNDFEIGGLGSGNIMDGSATPNSCHGCMITDNWLGDAATNWSGTFLNQVSGGVQISGNEITGQGSTSSPKVMVLGTTEFGVTFTGNYVTGFGTVFTFGSADTAIVIDGNGYNGNTQFLDGGVVGGLVVNPASPTLSPATGFNSGSFEACCSETNTRSTNFTVTVGTGTANNSGTISFPVQAPHVWVCSVQDTTNPPSNLPRTSSSTNTSATVTNYNNSGVATNWTNGDVLLFQCGAS